MFTSLLCTKQIVIANVLLMIIMNIYVALYTNARHQDFKGSFGERQRLQSQLRWGEGGGGGREGGGEGGRSIEQGNECTQTEGGTYVR